MSQDKHHKQDYACIGGVFFRYVFWNKFRTFIMNEIIPLKKINVNSFLAYQVIYIMNVIECIGAVSKPEITRTRACNAKSNKKKSHVPVLKWKHTQKNHMLVPLVWTNWNGSAI